MTELLRRSSVLIVLRGTKLLSFILALALSADKFGSGNQRDLWVLAFTGVLVTGQLLWGGMNDTFRVRFVFVKNQEGEVMAMKRVLGLVAITVVFSGFISLALMPFLRELLTFFAPVYRGDELEQLVFIVRILLPLIALNQLVQLGTGVLNTYESFYLPEIAAIASSAINIGLIWSLSASWGIYALVIAQYAATLALLIIVVTALRKHLRVSCGSVYDLLRSGLPFLSYALPFLLPYLLGVAGVLIEKSLASGMGEGAVSRLDYARRLIDVPAGVILSLITSVMAPKLSSFFLERENTALRNEIRGSLSVYFVCVIFLVAQFTAFSPLVTQVLYGAGKVSVSDLKDIAGLSRDYSWSLVGLFFYTLFGAILLGMGKRKHFAFAGIAVQVSFVLIIVLCHGFWGVSVFPKAYGISHALVAFAMFFAVPYNRADLWALCLRNIGCMVTIVAGVYGLSRLLPGGQAPVLALLEGLALTLVVLIVGQFLFFRSDFNDFLHRLRVKSIG